MFNATFQHSSTPNIYPTAVAIPPYACTGAKQKHDLRRLPIAVQACDWWG